MSDADPFEVFVRTYQDMVYATAVRLLGRPADAYGRLLRSRKLVGVRGAGLPFDGLYYVKSVTHEIERGAYKQSFQLARNALVSTTPTVPV